MFDKYYLFVLQNIADTNQEFRWLVSAKNPLKAERKVFQDANKEIPDAIWAIKSIERIY